MKPRHWLIPAAGVLPLVWLALPRPASKTPDLYSGLESVEPKTSTNSSFAQPLFGLCALQEIRIGQGAVIDDTTSTLEHYLEGRALNTGNALCWSFGEIAVEARAGGNPTVVVGHARPGWKGGVALTKGAFVTGSIEPVQTPRHLPHLAGLERGALKDLHGGLKPLRLTGNAVRFGRVQLTDHQELHLVGPLQAHIDFLECRGQSRVHLDTSHGPIALRIASGIRMGSESTWDSTAATASRVAILVGEGTPNIESQSMDAKTEEERRADRLRLRLRGEANEALRPTLELAHHGHFVGLLYAPFSNVRLPAGLRFQGVLTANRFTLDPGSRATTDRSALQAWPLKNEAQPR